MIKLKDMLMVIKSHCVVKKGGEIIHEHYVMDTLDDLPLEIRGLKVKWVGTEYDTLCVVVD